jgi:hypothetical protein
MSDHFGGVSEAVPDGANARDTERRQLEARAGLRPIRKALTVAQLGHDEPIVCLAGADATAALADDWEHGRQTCIDVLCPYVRMSYRPDPGQDVPAVERLVLSRDQSVRHTIIGIIPATCR